MDFLPAFLIEYSDSSFTNPHEVVLPDEPAECTGNFTHMGAKYWGFETSRHMPYARTDSGFRFNHHSTHEFLIGLTHQSTVEEIHVSTKWFTGNQVPFVSIELIDGDESEWVVERAKLKPDEDHVFTVASIQATHCRVHCFHEGGIARVNLFGTAGEALLENENLLERASISYVSNDHYGSPTMAVEGKREQDYMIGWESARSGFGEQCVFSFDAPTAVKTLIVDTYLHRLNPPLSCHLFGLVDDDIDTAMKQQPRWCLQFDNGTELVPDDIQAFMSDKSYLKLGLSEFNITLKVEEDSPWIPLAPFSDLKPDTWHEIALEPAPPVKHLLYMHFPNGGVHGLKVFGENH